MTHRVVMGVDPGLSNVGVAVVSFRVNKPVVLSVVTLVQPPGGNQAAKLNWIARELWALATAHRPEALSVEDIASVEVGMQRARRTNKASRRGLEVLGMVRAVAAALGAPCYEVAANTAKLSLSGSGSASKIEMVTAAKRLFGLVDVSEHGADALGVAKAGHGLHCLASMRHATDSLARRAHLGHRG